MSRGELYHKSLLFLERVLMLALAVMVLTGTSWDSIAIICFQTALCGFLKNRFRDMP